jgi:hypothetical protein
MARRTDPGTGDGAQAPGLREHTLSVLEITRAWSSPISPTSLTIAAVFPDLGALSSRLRSEVFPLPGKPVRSTGGSLS